MLFQRLILTATLFLVGLAPSISWGAVSNSNPEAKWLLEVPPAGDLDDSDGAGTSSRPAPTSGGTQSIHRNQRFYFPIYDTGGDDQILVYNAAGVADDATVTTCTSEVSSGDCVSAPLHIASTTAVICVAGDIATSGAVTTPVNVRVCATKACTATASTQYGEPLVEAAGTVCGEGGEIDLADGANLGGQWIYVSLKTAVPTGDSLLVWVVGQ